MNNNELFDALSGIDPKYIDEAAFELRTEENSVAQHDNVVSAKDHKTNNRRTSNIRRMVFIALPSVAAILLIVGVALPAVMRISNSESTTAPAYSEAAEAPASEAAAEEPSYDMAAEEPSYNEASEAPAPEAAAEEPSYDMAAEEPAYDESAGAEAMPDAVSEAEEAPAVAEEPAAESATTSGAAEESEETFNTYDGSESNKHVKRGEEALTLNKFTLEKAAYDNGILAIDIAGVTPDRPEELEYTINSPDGNGTENTVASGILADIMTETGLQYNTATDQTEKLSLKLDLTSFDLAKGDYTISIGNDTIAFTVR